MPDIGTDLQSKINRAVRAVLLNAGAVNPNNCYAAPSSAQHMLPNTQIFTGDGVQGSEFGPGNFVFEEVTVLLNDEATIQPNMPDPRQPQANASNRATNIFNALAQSSDAGTTLEYMAALITALGQALAQNPDDADMANFTCLWWESVVVGTMKQPDETTWQRELKFRCVACNAAFPN